MNDENSIIFHSQKVANLYKQVFAKRYQISGGSANLTTGVGDASGHFASALPAPNPSSGGRATSFAVDVPAMTGAARG